MAFQLDDQFKALKEKFKEDDAAFNLVDMEKCLREFKTELYIKRDQVKQLRIDLEFSTTENVQLKKTLHSTTKALEEKTFNVNTFTKKFHNNEEELYEKQDALNNIQLLHKLSVAEVEKLKELLQKSETEKLDLSRRLEVCETKLRQSNIYENIILKRESNLKNDIEKLEDMVKTVNSEFSEVAQLFKNTKLAEESVEKCKQITRSYERLKAERDHFEEMYIKEKAKYEMLEKLMDLNKDLNEPDLVNSIIINQWKASLTHQAKHGKETNEILSKLTDCYNNEKMANAKLIINNENLKLDIDKLKNEIEKLKDVNESMQTSHQEEIEHLKKKLSELNEKRNENNVQNLEIKEEPVVVDD